MEKVFHFETFFPSFRHFLETNQPSIWGIFQQKNRYFTYILLPLGTLFSFFIFALDFTPEEPLNNVHNQSQSYDPLIMEQECLAYNVLFLRDKLRPHTCNFPYRSRHSLNEISRPSTEVQCSQHNFKIYM